MTKEQSTIMKGVAILLMLYWHLFCIEGNVELCSTYLAMGDVPLVHWLARATNPVAFFLILSGYGLFASQRSLKGSNCSKGLKGDMELISHSSNFSNSLNFSNFCKDLKRILRLYIHYWITLLIFVPLGAYVVGTQRYPGSWESVIANVTAWHTTWNGEIWFLFPYVLLALSARGIFWLMERVNKWVFLGGVLLLSVGAQYLTSRYGGSYLYHHQLPYMPVLYFNLLGAFVMGAYMAKYNVVERCKTLNISILNRGGIGSYSYC